MTNLLFKNVKYDSVEAKSDLALQNLFLLFQGSSIAFNYSSTPPRPKQQSGKK